MSLAIKSNLDPNKLEQWIKQASDFIHIPNNDYTVQTFATLGVPIKNTLPAMVKMNVKSETKTILLMYQLESLPG